MHYDSGYQAAITAAAALLADRLPELPHLLSPTELWHLPQTTVEAAHQAQLHLGAQVKVAEAESVSAKWTHGVLCLDSEKQPVSWTAVARELAKAVAPRRNAGGLALGLKEVLATESIEDATAVLDELGYL